MNSWRRRLLLALLCLPLAACWTGRLWLDDDWLRRRSDESLGTTAVTADAEAAGDVALYVQVPPMSAAASHDFGLDGAGWVRVVPGRFEQKLNTALAQAYAAERGAASLFVRIDRRGDGDLGVRIGDLASWGVRGGDEPDGGAVVTGALTWRPVDAPAGASWPIDVRLVRSERAVPIPGRALQVVSTPVALALDAVTLPFQLLVLAFGR